ncbi:MAG: TetR/AcrR family transcriptional regulator [Chloroflexi bacterium]|nr:TetR/AcrR family transcriptional regulator [Chloroflexota bacterium]
MATKADNLGSTGETNDSTPTRETLNINDVLKTAATLIRQRGYHGTSMQDIADALGIRKSSLYHHVKTKQDMLFLILNEAIEGVTRGILEVHAQDLRPSEKLHLAIRNHLILLEERQESIGVLLRERNSLDPEYSKVYIPKRKRYEKEFQRIIEEGIKEGEFRAVDVKTTTYAILGMCNWMVQWYSPKGQKSMDEFVELFTDLAMRMLT